MLVCISLSWSFFCSSWRCVDPEDNVEESPSHMSSPIKVRCDASTDFVVKPFSFTITYVDPDIAGKRVSENNTRPFSWHWPGDDESILPRVTSIISTTILSIMNAAIAGLPDPSRRLRELLNCLEEPKGDGGMYSRNVTPILDNNNAAWWVKAAMKFSNVTLFGVVYRSQQTDGTAGAHTPMRGYRSYLPLDDIPPPPAKDMIDDIGEELDDDAEMWCPNPRLFPTTKTGFQKLERKLQNVIVRQQRYFEVIRNHTLGYFADYKKGVVADKYMAWVREHVHIVNPSAAGTSANLKCTSCRPAANSSLWGWNALAARLFKELHSGWVFSWHFGGWTDGW